MKEADVDALVSLYRDWQADSLINLRTQLLEHSALLKQPTQAIIPAGAKLQDFATIGQPVDGAQLTEEERRNLVQMKNPDASSVRDC